MKCSECGAELSEDTKFCSYCGQKVKYTTNTFEDSATTADINMQDGISETETKISSGKATTSQKIKNKGVEFWNGLDTFGKITIVAIVLFALLCLVAFIFKKTFAGIIALVQIALIVVAILMKKQIIKVKKGWIHFALIALAFLLLVPYVGLFNTQETRGERFAWSDIILGEVIPEPKSNRGEIYNNSDDNLSLDIYNTSKTQYSDYVEACKDKGFTVDVEDLDSSFDAYNETGYKLSLDYFERDNRLGITVDKAIDLGVIEWPESGLALFIPEPGSEKGKIDQDDEKGFNAYVGSVSLADYKDYTNLCANMGFTIEAKETEKTFYAKNPEGYRLDVDYEGYNTIYISIVEPEYNVEIKVDCVENLIFSKYDVEVYVDDSHQGTLAHGATETYSLTLTKDNYIVKFVSAENDTLSGEVSIDIAKDESFEYKIYTSSSEIRVDTIMGTSSKNSPTGDEEAEETEKNPEEEATETAKITVTMSEDDFMGMEYTETETLLREMGFTVFEYQILQTDDQSKADDTIGAIEIKSWIFDNGDFSVGDSYETDATVVIWYYDCNEVEPNLTVDNCEELAEILSKKGETDPSYVNFASKYKGKIIEFDGSIDYLTNHGNYKTRYDMLISVGDYSETDFFGPIFKFEEIGTSKIDFGDQDQFTAGTNVHIIAEVDSFNSSSYLFFLKPISISVR